MLIGVIFLFIFSRLQLTSKKPMLNLRVFKEPSFLIAVVISICLYLISMGSAVFNTIRQISGSLASTMAVLLYTLAGSDINAIRVVYIYFVEEIMHGRKDESGVWRFIRY